MSDKFLQTACLLGGAILIWLTLAGSVIGGVIIAETYLHTSGSSSDSFTDENGKKCSILKVDPFTALCP